jgi:DNA-binding protein YbaB
LGCDLRLLDGAPILTRDILEDEFEKYVIQAKKGKHITLKEVTVQHSDFEFLERLILKALALGKLKPS